ncbi:AAA family ATPase [Stutzerimonas stutzeri]|uniref:AAA family ATPase n=1 Tax=Stutzerimonas stutzeri TaxID=316 RepID=A0AA42P852_STUST|nr:AAA family ATPase [Stutzerimonas stutzeri]MDH1236514.1 AAA family ATPase [Stutzerimonas stutzeri]
MSNQQALKAISRILNIFTSSEAQIRPHFMLTGPSGSGKSHTIQSLADALQIPMVEVNAAQLTKEGTSGNSVSKALTPLLQYGGMPVICFVDEFDKLFISGNSNSSLAHETTNGVQNEFLKVLEGRASIYGDYGKYVDIKTDNVLFVFAGAFNGEENIDLDRLREMGIKTEFLGRVGLAYGLEKLTLDDLRQILESSNLLANYLELFTDAKKAEVVKAVMTVVEQNFEKNTIGARLINTLIHQYFINGGLNEKEARKVTFQKTMTLH